jgi:hypothetical protein
VFFVATNKEYKMNTETIQVTTETYVKEDTLLKQSNESLELKRQAAILELGEKWILHPKNMVQRKTKK